MNPRDAESGPAARAPAAPSGPVAPASPPRPPALLGDAFEPTLAAARTGDGRAFARLYDNVAPLVLGYLRGLRVPDPEDVAGEVFVDLVKGLDTFEGGERQFRSWLLTIAHRRAIDDGRRRHARPGTAGPLPDDVPGDRGADGTGAVVLTSSGTPGGVAATEDQVMENLSVLRILDAIDGLTPDQCAAVMLRVIADLTVPEVAQAMGKPPSAVKALLRRATARLARSLD